ncbi:MAG: pyridoxal phosphate-dependent aminotransferase family protein [Syntrophaceae bacterium]|nr:pyridoxal phosphate-dependent aminotransferase family protein [Syntrophaceae bacterium]
MPEENDQLSVALKQVLNHQPSHSDHKLFAEDTTVQLALLIKEMGLYPYFIPISGQIGPRIIIDGKDTINLGSNNYMGLANHPEMIKAGCDAMRKYGTGCTGSRFLNGTLDIHNELEIKLAKFFQKEAALCFTTGMQTNLGVISGITRQGDHIISDEKNHASIIDGCRLAHADTRIYRHNNMDDLEKVLAGLPPQGNRWIISDSIFSMEGNVAQIPRIVELAERHKARVIIDDAHGIGHFGKHGEGICGHLGLMDKIDILVGTFSKSFASIGGFCAAGRDIIQHLQHHARSLMFSASMPPAMAATAGKALDIFYQDDEGRKRVLQNASFLRKGIESLGFRTVPQQIPTPIIPIIIGDVMKLAYFNKGLLENGVYTNPVIPPASSEAMIRMSVMATHRQKDLEDALIVLKKEGRKQGLIK